jgi:hypothetical protein
MVEWSAVRCNFCRRPVTIADRCQWTGLASKPVVTLGAFAFGSALGLVFFQVPPSLLAMSIAVVIGFWSVFRSTPAEPKHALEY